VEGVAGSGDDLWRAVGPRQAMIRRLITPRRRDGNPAQGTNDPRDGVAGAVRRRPGGEGPGHWEAARPRLLPEGLPPGIPGDPGWFGSDSQVWRVWRERLLLLGGPAALLLQLAHPLIAAGVAAHSSFRDDPLRRLRATLDATLTVVFGDRRQAQMAAARVGKLHQRVRGRLPMKAGCFPAGTVYRASDPQLALWVHATLVVVALD
jgi:hypothetical protein